MKVVVFGATGGLGSECVKQALEAGHDVHVLVRTPSKLSADFAARVTVHEGNALEAEAVDRVMEGGCDAVLFAIGVDKHSPEDLCTTATRHILDRLRREGTGRFIWCGGGSTLVEEDQVTLGARFVEFFGKNFLGLRNRDKVHQLELLGDSLDVDWFGVRPLQMGAGSRKELYRLGFNPFSGFSRISFADCAHSMVGMLTGDTWRHKAPIVQY